MKKIIIIIIFIFTLTGCNSYTELNDLSVVNSLGISYSNNTYNINLSILKKDQEERGIEVFTSSNKNLNDAIHDIYLTSNKKLYLSHLDLVILDSNAINYKLKEILDNFLKNNEYRNNFQVIIMSNDDINYFFNEKKEAEDINNLVKTNSIETGLTYKKELEVFLNDILTNNNSYLPTFSFKDSDLTLEGYTLIRNNKVHSKLSNKESILLNLLDNKINKSYINDINIFENKTSIKTNKNIVTFDLDMTVNEVSKDKIKKLEEELLEFIKYYQQNDYDLLNVVELIKKNDYRYYKNNSNLLEKIEFKININANNQRDYVKGGL